MLEKKKRKNETKNKTSRYTDQAILPRASVLPRKSGKLAKCRKSKTKKGKVKVVVVLVKRSAITHAHAQEARTTIIFLKLFSLSLHLFYTQIYIGMYNIYTIIFMVDTIDYT